MRGWITGLTHFFVGCDIHHITSHHIAFIVWGLFTNVSMLETLFYVALKIFWAFLVALGLFRVYRVAKVTIKHLRRTRRRIRVREHSSL
jgi:membrane protein YdbS with pleckstrin-like domain